jgi:hypothetical protein
MSEENEKKPWYADMPPEDDALYTESVNRIKNGVQQSNLTFEKAIELIEVENEGMKAAIVDDALKVLVAEMHFIGGTSLDDLSKKLQLPVKRLEQARKEMLKDVEEAAIQKFKEDQGQVGNA